MEKIRKKIPGTSKKQNLKLPHTGDYLHSIYIALRSESDLELI